MRERKLIFNQPSGTDEINVSPLIDIVFILLIFFIVTTVFVEETGVDVQRPQSASASDLEKQSFHHRCTGMKRLISVGSGTGSGVIHGIVSPR